MSFSLTRLNFSRNIRTRVFTDPTQYDTEINAARGFSKPSVTTSVAPVKQAMEQFFPRVTEQEVLEAQNLWAQSIVEISKSFLMGGDYVSLAGERAGELYDALDRTAEAKDAYVRGHAYRRAVELCRRPGSNLNHEVVELEEKWREKRRVRARWCQKPKNPSSSGPHSLIRTCPGAPVSSAKLVTDPPSTSPRPPRGTGGIAVPGTVQGKE